MTSIELLVSGYRMGHKMVQILCEDLTEAEFHYQPVPGANSAAWIVGHLAVTARRTAERLGSNDLPVLSEEFVGKYSQTKKMAVTQSELGNKQELLSLLGVCARKLLEALQTVPPSGLDAPSPSPGPFAQYYGEAILFGAMHFTLHSGQLSTIRRSLGKPPLL
jgi:hypothetical protein